jgi:hypothetical protein
LCDEREHQLLLEETVVDIHLKPWDLHTEGHSPAQASRRRLPRRHPRLLLHAPRAAGSIYPLAGRLVMEHHADETIAVRHN